MRTQFMRIVKHAGLKPWPRLFHAMRGSRETELAREYPIHVVTSWLGNTVSIAIKHYLQVTDSDFARASRSGAQVAQNTAQHTRVSNCMESPELKPTPINTEFGQHQTLVSATVQNVKPEEEGFEPRQDSPEKTTVSEQGGAQSGAHAAPTSDSDPDLADVIRAWPGLPEAVRVGIVAMVKAASCTTVHGDERHE